MVKCILEVLERNRSEPRIYTFDTLPVRVGRGYRNDLILTDPFVSPEHLVITEDEQGFVIEDLAGENGILINGRKVKDRVVHIQSGEMVKAGGSNLRILSPDHPVVPTVVFNFMARAEKSILFRFCAWGLFVPAMGVVVLDEYLTTFSPVGLKGELSRAVTAMMILCFLWAGFWALVGYAVQRRAMFHAQLFIVTAFVFAISSVSFIPEYVAFALNTPVLVKILNYMGNSALFAVLLFYSLGIATSVKKRSRLIIVFSMIAVVCGLDGMSHVAERDDFKATPQFSALVKPPYVQLVSGSSVSEFLEKSEDVFVKAAPAKE
ncbi:MAG: FHA domain-containing protein [Kiritimatiellaceae bacterium]|nr:FHA domain-containing protein [Kiritimatiellaceae bacterium]